MFVIATNNAHKLVEFRRILTPLGIEVCSQADVNVSIDVVEDADTFEGNARLKAVAIHNATHMATISDDSGMEVTALGNAPGIYSARYGGDITSAEQCKLILQEMDGKTDRSARFVSCIYLVLADGKEHCFTGVCEGEIGSNPDGTDGFGYDPIFYVNQKSFARMSDEQKDAVSHRGKALRQLKEFLDMEQRKGENNDNK